MLETSARLLALLSLLQTRRDWPGEALAERLEVSPRTVRRDVDRLRSLGYPVRSTKGREGGYRLDAGADLPPLVFDDEQAVAVAVALQTATGSVTGVEEAALRALATVRQVMPARLRHRLDALQVTAVDRAPAGSRTSVDTEVLLALGTAVRAREVLRFGYRAATPGPDDPPTRRAEPHHLVTWGGRWYLVAFDLDRHDWRTFRVDRMDPRTPTGPRFVPRPLPAPDVAAYVSASFRRAVDPCRGEVVLHCPATQVAGWIGERGTVEEIAPDRCRVTVGSWSWVGLAAWLGLFGVDLDVVGPPELRAATAELARRYGRAATGDPGVGDPGVGDPGVGDPATGDPATGDPGVGR